MEPDRTPSPSGGEMTPEQLKRVKDLFAAALEVDPEKRAAFMAAYTFLGCTGWEVVAPESDVFLKVFWLTDRSVSEPEFIAWLRRSCTKLSPRKSRSHGGKRPRRKRRRNRP